MELASILPGYVTLNIHTKEEAWPGMPAGMALADETFENALVINANPYGVYTLEVFIKFEEESK
jgi:hypothetical protein